MTPTRRLQCVMIQMGQWSLSPRIFLLLWFFLKFNGHVIRRGIVLKLFLSIWALIPTLENPIQFIGASDTKNKIHF